MLTEPLKRIIPIRGDHLIFNQRKAQILKRYLIGPHTPILDREALDV